MTHWDKLEQEARGIIEKTLEQLPTELQEPSGSIPVVLETSPTPEMCAEGIDTDTLGLFIGESHDMAGENLHPLPGQIFLFLENIWSFAEEDIERYREEVTVTLLHEIGHYLGLDEQDMFDRGLD